MNKEDVLIIDVYYCPVCGYERPRDSLKAGKYCPRCKPKRIVLKQRWKVVKI